ncbi:MULTISPECIES: GNAT family N-acetyltransferase [unclassified Crossiella]|uniref:GNAT family N-acetyltransferase n=1 Tax=unclassified Crossiella TaxID=2620835 RepID=UPI001FFF2477|nr:MULTISPECIES: GNAT family N-acetyltransferase [unclassified Crossiella]MCK2241512.1 GNAT family N-acetyltransferase [Crossiella sp. S99.2]MCK2255616.1 GNAT family N-acetyltransferase [Crossiella sp. S99.1]
MPTIRPATPADLARLPEIDNSFTTDAIIEVTTTPQGFELKERPLPTPIHKTYPVDEDPADAPTQVYVATEGDTLCGFIALTHETWNHRLSITAIELSPTHRGQGLGRALMEQGATYGKSQGARTYWLEVTNLNAPAIRAYQHWGFTFCGLDTTLYTGTSTPTETALFMSRSLEPAPAATSTSASASAPQGATAPTTAPGPVAAPTPAPSAAPAPALDPAPTPTADLPAAPDPHPHPAPAPDLAPTAAPTPKPEDRP